jgi:hypothetical protein
MGFVRFSFELFNAMDQRLMTMAASLMMGRRDTFPRDALFAGAPRRESE